MNRSQRGFRRGQNTGRRGGQWRGNPRSFEGFRNKQNDFGRRRNFDSFDQPPSKRIKRDVPTKRLSEKEVGITEYIGDHQGFTGIIKSRYSDFQVSEINLKGEIAVLTDLSVPQPPSDNGKVEEDEELFNKYNLQILPMETWDSINKLVIGESDEKVEVDMTGKSKEERTKIHETVKAAFGPSVVGTTTTRNIDGEEKKFVCFDKHRKGVRVDKRVKWVWPGEYVHFLLHKENCDTMEAARIIASQLRLNIKPSMLGYAGTKDRRAKTTQWLSLRKVDPRKISEGCSKLRGLHVGNFTFSDHTIKLGQIKGNKFRIALRNATAPEEVMSAACEQLNKKGFINYYGLQRFGTRAEMPTYEIGKKILQGKYKEAMTSVLELNNEDHLDEVVRSYKTFGLGGALKVIGQCNVTLLKKTLPLMVKNDFLSAVNQIPRNTRLLYLHSCQSLLWNNAVSERIRRFGLTPQPGDLIALEELLEEEIVEAELEAGTNDEENETEAESKEKEENSAEKEEIQTEKDKDEKPKVGVKMLTQEDIDSGKYTIADVVMPMPGFRVEYPSNMIDYFEEELKKDGLDLKMINKVRSFSMSGTYRRIVARPTDVEWRVVTYNDPYIDLILSDIDHINKRQLNSVTDGKFKALLLTMTLPSSCYATMALRELLRIDTSCDFQAAQNDYYKEVKSD